MSKFSIYVYVQSLHITPTTMIQTLFSKNTESLLIQHDALS